MSASCHLVRCSRKASFLTLLLSGLLFAVFARAQSAAPRLEIHRPGTSNDWVRLNNSAQSDSVFTLEASANLTAWTNIATLHDALLQYPDAGSESFDHRFYRTQARARGANDDWKNQAWFPEEPFRSPSPGGSGVLGEVRHPAR